MGASQSGIGCAFMDCVPRFSGPFTTVGNTLGAIAGIAGPIVVALFTDTWGDWGWKAVFFLTVGMSLASLVAWRIFQTSEVIPSLNTLVPKKL